MTVANSLNKHTYVGNGVTIEWPYTFKIFKNTDIQVILTEIATGADTIIASNYTVDMVNNIVTYPSAGSPLASTYKVTINRKVPITQETALPNGGPYLAKTIESAFDKEIIIDQQQQEQLSRSLLHSISVDDDVSNELPAPVPLQSFRWDSTGKKLETTLDPATVLPGAIEAKEDAQAAQAAAEAAQANAIAAKLAAQAAQTAAESALNVRVLKGADCVNIKSPPPPFVGAVGDGVADDTTAIQTLANNFTSLYIPDGTFLTGNVTIPSTLKYIYGNGINSVIKPKTGFANTTTSLWATTSNNGFIISKITFNVNYTTWSNVTPLSLTTCDNAIVDHCIFNQGGFQPVYLANCTNSVIQNCYCNGFSSKGIRLEGSNSNNNNVINNVVIGVGIASGISAQLGSDYMFSGNFVANSKGFGLSLYQTNAGSIINNKTINTNLEGINIEDSSVVLIDSNRCEWTAGFGDDMGISIYGNPSSGAYCQYNTVSNNQITSAHASGIGVCDYASYNLITNNNILNPNVGKSLTHTAPMAGTQAMHNNYAGIILYGTNCTNNQVSNNILTDVQATKTMVYAVSDAIDIGTGLASSNTITNNHVNGYLTAEINRSASTIRAMNTSDMDYRTYTPTVTATTGTITTVGAASGYFIEMGHLVFLYASVAITTNGTGAGALNITLPINASRGLVYGKEIALTGKSVIAELTSTAAVCRLYDNTYPGGTGAIVVISGFYQR